MRVNKHWIFAASLGAAVLAGGLSCQNILPKPKKRTYAQPITASVHARNVRSQISFTLLLKDANGKPLSGLVLPTGKRPPPPKVTVVDAEGNEVYTFSMRYG